MCMKNVFVISFFGGEGVGCFLWFIRGRGLLELENKKKNNELDFMNEIVF